MKKGKLNWKRIWDQFYQWMDDEEAKLRAKRCQTCGAKPLNRSIDWEQQQDAIERIVEANR